MSQVAMVFKNGGSQAVRLPSAFRFGTTRVYVRRDDAGDVVLSERPADWEAFIDTVRHMTVPEGFLGPESRGGAERDLFGEVG